MFFKSTQNQLLKEPIKTIVNSNQQTWRLWLHLDASVLLLYSACLLLNTACRSTMEPFQWLPWP